MYSAEQESASETAERSAQFAAFSASLPFNSTLRSNADYQQNDDPMRRSMNSITSELSQDNNANLRTSAEHAPNNKITLPTIVENQTGNESNNVLEQELDDKNKRNERSK